MTEPDPEALVHVLRGQERRDRDAEIHDEIKNTERVVDEIAATQRHPDPEDADAGLPPSS
jgi:hypothetical protein